MEKYTIATANQLEGIFRAYNSGLEDGVWLYIETFNLLNYDSFCIEQQKRVDMGLQPTIATQRLIKEMCDYLKGDEQRFSGFEFDNGVLNDLDRLHLEAERWVNTFADYYKSPVRAGMPQQEQPKQPEQQEQREEQKKGKPNKSFRECFICEPEEQETILKKLHQVLKGKKGKNVALAIYVCMDKGKIIKPTFGAVKNEFGDIGNPSGYNSYLRDTPFEDIEKEGMKKALFD